MKLEYFSARCLPDLLSVCYAFVHSLPPDVRNRKSHTQPPTDLGERHHVRQPDHFRDPSADALVQNVDREREVDIDEGVLLPQFQIVRVPGRAQNLPDRRRMFFQFIVGSTG